MFKVQFNGGASRDAIRNAAAKLKDMTPVYRQIGEYMEQATRERFIQGVAPDGTAWAPKSQTTLDRYKRRGYNGLTRPLIGPGKRLSREIVQLVSKDGVVIGSSVIYAAVQQGGAAKGAFGNRGGRPIPWGNIPARPFLGISEKDEKAIMTIVDKMIELDNGT